MTSFDWRATLLCQPYALMHTLWSGYWKILHRPWKSFSNSHGQEFRRFGWLLRPACNWYRSLVECWEEVLYPLVQYVNSGFGVDTWNLDSRKLSLFQIWIHLITHCVSDFQKLRFLSLSPNFEFPQDSEKLSLGCILISQLQKAQLHSDSSLLYFS